MEFFSVANHVIDCYLPAVIAEKAKSTRNSRSYGPFEGILYTTTMNNSREHLSFISESEEEKESPNEFQPIILLLVQIQSQEIELHPRVKGKMSERDWGLMEKIGVYGSIVIVLAVIGLIAMMTYEVWTYEITYRYYNDHPTEWAIIKIGVALLFLQIAAYLLRFKESDRGS
jgi:hypothetical protein